MNDDGLPNAGRAQRNQARKRQFLPRVWPAVAVVVIIVVVALLLSR